MKSQVLKAKQKKDDKDQDERGLPRLLVAPSMHPLNKIQNSMLLLMNAAKPRPVKKRWYI